jgi:C-methyltransferase C-terminal domain/Putative zinc binding domain/Methyltransferase domain
MLVRHLKECRVCRRAELTAVLDLGDQELTGVFPSQRDDPVPSGPLQLVLCPHCGLLQLAHNFELSAMYGDNYGYRSGLNQSMVEHLTRKIQSLERRAGLAPGDVVLDIGSNDCTSLKAYQTQALKRIGIDPTGSKFRQYYPSDVNLVPEFFSASAYRRVSDKPARVVTSIAMFYDLERPIDFAREVADILSDDGIWHFEQSYMPAMLRLNSYDTVCHEHLEYYSLSVVKFILEAADLKIVDVEMNAINGGSFAVTAAKKSSQALVNQPIVEWLLAKEAAMDLRATKPYLAFAERVTQHRTELSQLLDALARSEKKVIGYGASTKGNVVLQYCNIDGRQVSAIAEVNPDKFGCYTPGTRLPIVSEAEALARKPDYYLVLPWHFRDGILKREQAFRDAGGKFIFPFPEIEVV